MQFARLRAHGKGSGAGVMVGAALSETERKEGQLEKLYLNIEEAAAYVGIGTNTMRDYVNSSDPPPMMRVGRKVLLQKSALAPYFERRQEVRL